MNPNDIVKNKLKEIILAAKIAATAPLIKNNPVTPIEPEK